MVIVSLLALFVFACSRKTIPTAENNLQENTTHTLSAADSVTLVKGKVVYINRCGRCHNLKPVQKYTAKEWSPVLQIMIHKARLNAIDSLSVTQYVLINAAKR